MDRNWSRNEKVVCEEAKQLLNVEFKQTKIAEEQKLKEQKNRLEKQLTDLNNKWTKFNRDSSLGKYSNELRFHLKKIYSEYYHFGMTRKFDLTEFTLIIRDIMSERYNLEFGKNAPVTVFNINVYEVINFRIGNI